MASRQVFECGLFAEATSDIIEGTYGSNVSEQIIYGTLTTPINAIGGSAVCAYRMADILEAFEGTFKAQESINSNWLPLSKDKVSFVTLLHMNGGFFNPKPFPVKLQI